MRRELAELVEAARALGVQAAPRPGAPTAIKIQGNREEFPDRLHRLAVALEGVDRAGSHSNDLEQDKDPSMDPGNLRVALDGIFRWMRSCGIDISEPHDIVAEAMGHPEKKQKSYKPVPVFAPDSSKKGAPGPLLRLTPEVGEETTIEKLREKARRAHSVEQTMGAAAPRQSMGRR